MKIGTIGAPYCSFEMPTYSDIWAGSTYEWFELQYENENMPSFRIIVK